MAFLDQINTLRVIDDLNRFDRDFRTRERRMYPPQCVISSGEGLDTNTTNAPDANTHLSDLLVNEFLVAADEDYSVLISVIESGFLRDLLGHPTGSKSRHCVRQPHPDSRGSLQECSDETLRRPLGDFVVQTTYPEEDVLVTLRQRDHDALFYLCYLPGAPFEPSEQEPIMNDPLPTHVLVRHV